MGPSLLLAPTQHETEFLVYSLPGLANGSRGGCGVTCPQETGVDFRQQMEQPHFSVPSETQSPRKLGCILPASIVWEGEGLPLSGKPKREIPGQQRAIPPQLSPPAPSHIPLFCAAPQLSLRHPDLEGGQHT